MQGAVNRKDSAVEDKEQEIYELRFSADENMVRAVTWRVLARELFQDYISAEATVLDIGAGEGFFLRNIKAQRRVAVDLNPRVKDLARYGIEPLNISALHIGAHFSDNVDFVLVSNFFEHLESKSQVVALLKQIYAALKVGGKLAVLQPNIRYARAAYWDYIDHHIALTDKSLAEAVAICGFRINRLLPRFLPYTAQAKGQSWISERGWEKLISLYLKCPWAQRLWGAQVLLIAEK